MNVKLKDAKTAVALVYLIFCALYILNYTLSNPHYDWDVIGYVASAFDYLGYSGSDLHARTYADVLDATRAWQFEELISGPYRNGVYVDGSYRNGVYLDPVALEQQLPFYKIRPLYVGLVLFASLFTGTITVATVVVSALLASFMVWVAACLADFRSLTALLLLPPLMFFGIIRAVSTLSNPDALAALIALAGFYLGRDRPRVALAFFVLIIFARTDFILLLPFAFLLVWGRVNTVELIIASVAAVVIYLGLTSAFSNYGYLHIFNFTLIAGPQPYPAQMVISDNIDDYLRAYYTGAWRMLGNTHLFLIAIFLLVVGRFRPWSYIEKVTLAGIGFMALHFVIFPAGFDRHYAVTIILGIIYLLGLLDHWVVRNFNNQFR